MQQVKEKIPIENRRFSYSASTTYQSCHMKYWLKYIEQVDKDPDVEDDGDALRFGKAMHSLLELYRHDYRWMGKPEFRLAHDKIMEENTITDPAVQTQILSCGVTASELHIRSKLEVVGIEVEIGDRDIIGYVDLVVGDVYGWWWIVDLKSSGLVVESLFARLHKDPQLSLYAHYAPMLAERLKLDVNKFAGVRYRVVQKPKTKPKQGESVSAYCTRADILCHEVVVDKAHLPTDEQFTKMKRLKQGAMILTHETAEKNVGNCIQYFRPCEFWSHCYGATYTVCKDMLPRFTQKNISDQTLTPDEDLLL
jgi:hypothetical protein